MPLGLHALLIRFFSDPLFDSNFMDCQLEELYLYDCIMTNCDKLDLTDNPIGIEGIITVGEILGVCNQSNVDLHGCHLTTAVGNISNPSSSDTIRDLGQQLGQMSKSTIWELVLDGNCFTGERIHILAGFICLCIYHWQSFLVKIVTSLLMT